MGDVIFGDVIFDLPSPLDGPGLAEWIERRMLIDVADSLPSVALFAGASGGVEPDSPELELAFSLVEARGDVAPDLYPLKITTEGAVERDDTVDATAYTAMLLLSLPDGQLRRDAAVDEAIQVFELLVREAAAGWFVDGEAVRFSRPDVDDRPESLRDAFRWLSERSGMPLGDLESIPAQARTAGVDVIGWRRGVDAPLDRLLLRILIDPLTREFESDISEEQLKAVLSPEGPLRFALATPHFLERGSEEAKDLRARHDPVLDRVALLAALDGSRLAAVPGWEAAKKLIEDVVGRVRDAAKPSGQSSDAVEREPNPLRQRRVQRAGPPAAPSEHK